MSLRNDIMRFSVLGFRSDIMIELQAPVVVATTGAFTLASVGYNLIKIKRTLSYSLNFQIKKYAS